MGYEGASKGLTVNSKKTYCIVHGETVQTPLIQFAVQLFVQLSIFYGFLSEQKSK